MAAIAFFKDAHSAEVNVARDGQALLPIVVSKEASQEIRDLAKELADGLGKISGGAFSISPEATPNGIIVGTSEEWPGYLPPPPAGISPLLTREDYLLKTETDKVLLIGRTPLAVQNAVWDLLYRLGFRQYFPGKQWEIWPRIRDLTLNLDAMESPDYFTRRLRVGASTWPENANAVQQWKRRNRMISGFTLSSGHSYERIVGMNKEFFAANPKAVSGSAREPKLDASFEPVLEVVANYALNELKNRPEMDSLSLEPSDGGGWREESPLGSPSNQAVVLANHASQAIQEHYPGRKVGIYAYNLHSPPPTITVDPNVIVGVATSFIKGGYTAEELMKGWHEKGAEIGVREYWGVSAWDHALPGRARAADIDYITQTIPEFYQLGARYWDGEVTDAWGVHGLGCYLTTRLLWDVKEAGNVTHIQDEFFKNSFGPAADAMQQYFEKCLLKSGKPLLSQNLIGKMYRLLDKALAQGASPEENARILDFIIYTRYVELMLAYQNAPEAKKKEAFLELANVVHRSRGTFMLDRWTTFREIPGRAFRVKKGDILEWLKPATAHDKPFENEELLRLVKEGIANNSVVDFEPIAFSTNLVPYTDATTGDMQRALSLRGTNHLYLYGDAPKSKFEFKVKGGLIYKDRGDVKLRLFSDQNAIIDEPVSEAVVPLDGEIHKVVLQSPYAGLHRLEVSDGSGGTQIAWPKGQRLTFPSSAEEGVTLGKEEQMVFFVPKGTKKVGGFSSSASGRMTTADGKVLHDFSGMQGAGYFLVDVPKKEDGTYWKIGGFAGRKLLMTVPPYLARSPEELLVPMETKKTL